MRDNGYTTAMFGKAGIGGEFDKQGGRVDVTRPMIDGPQQWGFDYSCVILRGHQSPPEVYIENGMPMLDVSKIEKVGANGKFYPEPFFDYFAIGQTLMDKAIVYLDQVAADPAHKPFFIHFNTAGAHGPNNPPDMLMGEPVKGVTGLGPRTDMVIEVDVIVGAFVKALRERGMLDNTIIFVTSDNGGLPYERARGHDSVAGLRGRKSYIFEGGGQRVPFVAWWSDRLPAGSTYTQPIAVHDIVATVLELAGIDCPADQALDSISFAHALLGMKSGERPVRETLVVQSSLARDAFDDGGFSSPSVIMSGGESQRLANKSKPASPEEKERILALPSGGMAHCLYEGDWKLTMDMNEQPVALYDLASDRGETNNLIDNPGQKERVQRLYESYLAIRSSESSKRLSASGGNI